MAETAEQPTSMELHVVVTRADGTVHDLGVVSATYRTPWRRTWWHLIGRHTARHRITKANRHQNKRG